MIEVRCAGLPTDPFIISEHQDQEIGKIGKIYVVKDRRATDFEASKL